MQQVRPSEPNIHKFKKKKKKERKEKLALATVGKWPTLRSRPFTQSQLLNATHSTPLPVGKGVWGKSCPGKDHEGRGTGDNVQTGSAGTKGR